MSARSRTALALVISATLIVPIAQGQPSPTVTTLHCRRDCTGVYGQVAAEWLYALDGTAWFSCPPEHTLAPCVDGEMGTLGDETVSVVDPVVSTDIVALTETVSPPLKAQPRGEVTATTTLYPSEHNPASSPHLIARSISIKKHVHHFNRSVSECLQRYQAPLTITKSFPSFDLQGRPTAIVYAVSTLPLPHWGVNNDSAEYYNTPVDPESQGCKSEDECRHVCEDRVRKAHQAHLLRWTLPLAGIGGLFTGLSLLATSLVCLRRHRRTRPKVIAVPVVKQVQIVPRTDGTVSIADPEHDGITLKKKAHVPKSTSAFSIFGRRHDSGVAVEEDRVAGPPVGDRRAVSTGSSADPDGIALERLPRIRESNAVA